MSWHGQTNKVLVEAWPVYEALGLKGAASFKPASPQASSNHGGKPTYELRTYQLQPGYGSVPKLVEEFRKGWVHDTQCTEHAGSDSLSRMC